MFIQQFLVLSCFILDLNNWKLCILFFIYSVSVFISILLICHSDVKCMSTPYIIQITKLISEGAHNSTILKEIFQVKLFNGKTWGLSLAFKT